MRKLVLQTLCLLIILSDSACSRKLNGEGSFQKSAVIADGELNDWTLPLRFGNKAGTVQYSITNDKDNIYLAILSRDEATEQKILRMGITVYFDPAGGESKNISISYPAKNAGGLQGEPTSGRSAGKEAPGNVSQKQELLLHESSFFITGFQHIENRAYELGVKNPVTVALKLHDDNTMVYEAVIPIRDVTGYPLSVNDQMKNCTAGFIIKGFQGNAQSGAGNGMVRGGTRGTGAGRGMHGGGMRGAGGSSVGTGRTALLQDDINWYRFRLAYK